MKPAYLLLGLVASIAQAATDESLNQNYTVSPGGKLVVDVDVGAIEVSRHPGSEVRIEVYRKVTLRSAEQEKAFLRDRPVEFTQDGSNIKVMVRKKTRAFTTSMWRGQGVEARYTIQVPEKFDAELTTSGGAIRAEDLQGAVHANTHGGGLHFEGLKGSVEGTTSGGAVRVQKCQGPINVKTSGGGIEVSEGNGSLHAETSGGPIRVRDFKGSVAVETSGGGITLDQIVGEISGTTSGGGITANLTEAPVGTVKLETSGGGVTVRLPATASFELDAATSGGEVKADFPVEIEGKRQHDRMHGTVNGGGKLIRLRSSGGSIRVRKP